MESVKYVKTDINEKLKYLQAIKQIWHKMLKFIDFENEDVPYIMHYELGSQ